MKAVAEAAAFIDDITWLHPAARRTEVPSMDAKWGRKCRLTVNKMTFSKNHVSMIGRGRLLLRKRQRTAQKLIFFSEQLGADD